MAIGAVQEREHKRYWDDVSGKPLIPGLARKARVEESGEISKHKVYEKVSLDKCWKATGQPPIVTRRVLAYHLPACMPACLPLAYHLPACLIKGENIVSFLTFLKFYGHLHMSAIP